MVKYIGKGLVAKRPGVLSKVQMLNLVLGVGVSSLLPRKRCRKFLAWLPLQSLAVNKKHISPIFHSISESDLGSTSGDFADLGPPGRATDM